jgi:hypothetical protein
MNATDWWLLQMNEAQWMLELVIGDVTAEMLAWTPPTTTNAVLWESASWGAQLSIAVPPRG